MTGRQSRLISWKRSFEFFLLSLAYGLISSCGTAATEEDSVGRCKPVSASKQVAATHDFDTSVAKPWQFKLLNAESFSGECRAAGGKISLEVWGQIFDSHQIAKAGLIVVPRAPEGVEVNFELSDLNTDSCGVAKAVFIVTCPPAGDSLNASVQLSSGGLFSLPVTIELRNTATVN